MAVLRGYSYGVLELVVLLVDVFVDGTMMEETVGEVEEGIIETHAHEQLEIDGWQGGDGHRIERDAQLEEEGVAEVNQERPDENVTQSDFPNTLVD